MKKVLSFVLAALCLLSLFACGRLPSDGDRLSVVTTIFCAYDFARAVCGDLAEIKMLLPAGAEAHTFDPSPRDMVDIENSDIFFYVGGENDAWVGKVLSSVECRNPVKMTDYVTLLKEELSEGMEGTVDGEDDEHVWTSPKNAVKIINGLKDEICAADPANAESYIENAESYIEKLNALDKEIRNIVENAPLKTIVVADRFPLIYFVKEYGLEYFAAFPGCSSEAEPSAVTVAFLIDRIKTENIPAIFKIELSNGSIADMLSNETGCRVLTFNSCHSVGADLFKSGATYISLMEQNLEALKEALDAAD